jgi:hypothetical protein
MTKKWWILMAIAAGLYMWSSPASASESSVPFTVTPVLPSNQNPDIISYFKLKADPNEKQTLHVWLENFENKEITVKMASNNALTSPLGEIQYVEIKQSDDARMIDETFAMKGHVMVEPSITLAPLERKKVAIEITAPSENKGVYLGGVTFVSQMNEAKKPEGEKKSGYQFKLNNEIGFAIAIEWDMPEPEKDRFSVESAGIRFIPSGVQSTIEIKNQHATILKDFNASYRVKNKAGEVLFEGKITNVNFAPKTMIRYPIYWRTTNLDEGTYILSIVTDYDGKKEDKDVPFTIGKAFIEDYGNTTGNMEVTSRAEAPAWILGGTGLLLVISLVLVIRRKRKTQLLTKDETKVKEGERGG